MTPTYDLDNKQTDKQNFFDRVSTLSQFMHTTD